MRNGFRRIFWALLAAGVFFPFAFLLVLSFWREWIFPDLGPSIWTLANWALLFQTQIEFGPIVLRSALISLSVATGATLLSFLTSRIIAFHPWRSILLLLAYFPFVLAPVILAACVHFFFVYFDGVGSLGGVVLAQVMIAYPYGILVFNGFWNRRLHDMEALAQNLGASPLQAWTRVLFPLSRGMLQVVFFQTFLISWFEYGLTRLLGLGKVQTLTLKVYLYLGEANIYLAALSACLLFFPPLVLLWTNRRFVYTPTMS